MWPGCKQLFRQRDAIGAPVGDTIALVDEPTSGEPLLREIMGAGHRVVDLPDLTRIRNDCREQLTSLPSPLRLLAQPDDKESIYPVAISRGLRALADSFDPNEE